MHGGKGLPPLPPCLQFAGSRFDHSLLKGSIYDMVSPIQWNHISLRKTCFIVVMDIQCMQSTKLPYWQFDKELVHSCARRTTCCINAYCHRVRCGFFRGSCAFLCQFISNRIVQEKRFVQSIQKFDVPVPSQIA